MYVDDIKLAGKKQNIDPMWKLDDKEVDLGEPTSFLDHVHLGCTQRQREISKDIVDNDRIMFKSRNSAGRGEKLSFPQNLRISSWFYDIVGRAKKCVERYCELANKTTQQLYKYLLHALMTTTSKKKKHNLLEKSQIHALRSVTKWTKACDKRLIRLISYIHHPCEYKQYCHVGNTAMQIGTVSGL